MKELLEVLQNELNNHDKVKAISHNSNRTFFKDLKDNSKKRFIILYFNYNPIRQKAVNYVSYYNFMFYDTDITKTQEGIKVSDQFYDKKHINIPSDSSDYTTVIDSNNAIYIHRDGIFLNIDHYRHNTKSDYSMSIDKTCISINCTGTLLSHYTVMGNYKVRFRDCTVKRTDNNDDAKTLRQDIMMVNNDHLRDIFVILDPKFEILPHVIEHDTKNKCN